MELLDIILENSYKPLYVITLLVSLVKYPRYYNSPLRFFPVLLMYTFLTETLGYITRHYDKYEIAVYANIINQNSIIYNIYNIIFFSFFIYVYWSFIENKRYKAHILGAALLFGLAALTNPFFQNFKITPQLLTYTIGGLVIIYCSILFFLENNKQNIRADPKYTTLRWISLGLTIFYMGYLPIRASRHYNYLHNISEYEHLRRIHLTLICILYLCFIIGLLRMKRKFWI